MVAWCKVSEFKWAEEFVHAALGMGCQNQERWRGDLQGGYNEAAQRAVKRASVWPGKGYQSPGGLERVSTQRVQKQLKNNHIQGH